MDALDLVGQTLDSKYQLERELGRGGMGTVYLANHLGTERPVAVKIISPQFMERAEFVERFRREARAAGRLRHPNVVDVTDFGFSLTKNGQVAYLVMEYLDGCTLGEILDEEKNLPVGWTLDILEQVCSAVQEAHQQGIIHRDLKPDNIWLEPNQRGGYTVKVLDFGIAKLEAHEAATGGEAPREFLRSTHTDVGGARTTFAGDIREQTIAGDALGTRVPESPMAPAVTDGRALASEAGTMMLTPAADEAATAIYLPREEDISDQETIRTRVASISHEPTSGPHSLSLYEGTGSAELTRVGAVLGTPLYMSPEQCRGEHLDARSDIYSLGVIAYQMLAGAPPFEGDYKAVMEAHKSVEPPPLPAKRVRKKLKRTIHSALAKDPAARPQSAEAFASQLRSRSEGIFGLLRRALVIYGEHLPKFLVLTTLVMLPVGLMTVATVVFQFLKVSEVLTEPAASIAVGVTSVLVSAGTFFCTYLIVGTITWMVTQYLAVPLRPVRVRPALKQARLKWKTLFGTGVMTTFLTFVIGILTCGIGIFVMSVLWALVSPVLMMENLKGRAALRRSRLLVRRSLSTAAGAVLIMFLIPFLTAGILSVLLGLAARAIDPPKPVATAQTSTSQTAAATVPASEADPQGTKDLDINFRNGSFEIRTADEARAADRSMQSRAKKAVLDSTIQLILWPLQILFISFSAIIVALLYIKTRLAGGESMYDLIERFEDDGRPRKKWQERVKARLIQSGRISSNPSR